jgi:hypothetical protein
VTLSDSTERWAREVRTAKTHATGTERFWLDQLEEYMGQATSKRPVTDSLAYCVVISEQQFGGISFRDYVQDQRVHFHPFTSGGWPSVPPNFLAFRWNNAVRQLNRVIDYEVVGHLDERFTSVTREESGGPHVAYRLGPDIPLPGDAVPSGRNLRNTRFWLLLDQLLTQPTVVEAHAASEALRA